MREGAASPGALAANAKSIEARRALPLTNDPAVRSRLAGVDADWARRVTSFADRIGQQQAILNLRPLPTTIGSFPPTTEVRKARAAYGKGVLDDAGYTQFLREETECAVRWQTGIVLLQILHPPRLVDFMPPHSLRRL